MFKSITSFSEYVDYAIFIGAVMLVPLLGMVITTYSSWLRASLKSTSVSILTLLDKRTKILSWIMTLIFLIIGVAVAYVILRLFNLRPTLIYLVLKRLFNRYVRYFRRNSIPNSSLNYRYGECLTISERHLDYR